MSPRAAAAAAALLVVVAIPFFAATTFYGDDHLFLAYARWAPHPFAAFAADAHGGEYYRPLPMAAWWLLGNMGRPGGGSTVPFAALAFLLHVGAAAMTGALLRALGRPPAVAVGAGALMLLAPQNLDAASWFSASTDLFATLLVLAALTAAVRGRVALAALAALGAYLSKESAYALPLLALLVLRGHPWRRRLAVVGPQLVLLAAVLAARTAVLHGWGGSADARAATAAKLLLQVPAGLALVFTGGGVLPLPLAFGLGTAIVALTVLSALRARGGGLGGGGDAGTRWLPLAFCAIAVLPLLAAGWVVGARYFYLPAVGLCWAVAEALVGAGAAARATIVVVLLLLGTLHAAKRRVEAASSDRRVAAARRAVAAGVAVGHRVFHIMSGVKDLDLAVKEDRSLPDAGVLVLTDVPASFVIIPPELAAGAAALVARPPIPPSGAYRFGPVRVVGLVRRGDEPALSEVIQMFPQIRFIRLLRVASGQIVARDVTDEVRATFQEETLDGDRDGRQD